jgi:hypothetical protein
MTFVCFPVDVFHLASQQNGIFRAFVRDDADLIKTTPGSVSLQTSIIVLCGVSGLLDWICFTG